MNGRPYFVHPAAIVETDSIGAGTRIWAFTHVLTGARVGADCNIGEGCFVESGAVVGDGVTIKNGTSIWSGVTLEDGVFVGPAAVFTNDVHPRSPRLDVAAARYERESEWLVPTVVRRGATVGAGAVVLAGATIGEFAFVAAGAVVTRDVAAHELVLGTPARRRGWVCRCGQPLDVAGSTTACARCATVYRVTGDGIATAEAPDAVA